jgi:hypothetical protein
MNVDLADRTGVSAVAADENHDGSPAARAALLTSSAALRPSGASEEFAPNATARSPRPMMRKGGAMVPIRAMWSTRSSASGSSIWETLWWQRRGPHVPGATGRNTARRVEKPLLLSMTCSLSLLGRAENARRSEEQKNQQHRKSSHILQPRPESKDGEGLRQTKRDAA